MSPLYERAPITIGKLKEWHEAVDVHVPDVGKMDEQLRSFELLTQAAIVGYAMGELCYPLTPDAGSNAVFAAWVVMLENVNRRANAALVIRAEPPGLHRSPVRRGDFRRRR